MPVSIQGELSRPTESTTPIGLIGNNHFKHRIYIKPEAWKDFFTANATQKYVGDEFYFKGTKWRLVIHPNGNKEDGSNVGSFKAAIFLTEQPKLWRRCIVNYKIYIPQLNAKWIDTNSFWPGRGHGVPDNAINVNEIKSLNAHAPLEIAVEIRLLIAIMKEDHVEYKQLLPYQNHVKFEWEINEELLSAMKNAKQGKMFHSDVYYDMWSVGITPNTSAGFVGTYLRLCGLPPYISKVEVEYEIRCEMCVRKDGTIIRADERLEFDYDFSGFPWPGPMWEMEDFQDYKKETMTLKFDIRITKKWDEGGNSMNENIARLMNYTIGDEEDEKFIALVQQMQYLSFKVNEFEGYKKVFYFTVALMLSVVIFSVTACWWIFENNGDCCKKDD